MGRNRLPNRLPWWGHSIVLALILCGVALSIATGDPLYAWILVPAGWLVGSILRRGTAPADHH